MNATVNARALSMTLYSILRHYDTSIALVNLRTIDAILHHDDVIDYITQK